MVITPEGFDRVHERGGTQHRLRADAAKWQPLGIGPSQESDAVGEGQAEPDPAPKAKAAVPEK
jgi:hypothetical protein